MGENKREPKYTANQLKAGIIVALVNGIAFGILLATGPCKPISMIKKLREEMGYAHPYYWAAFTLTGDS